MDWFLYDIGLRHESVKRVSSGQYSPSINHPNLNTFGYI